MITQKSVKVKSMARPIQFNRPLALKQSMYLFWENGYTNTSLQQLGERMDMRPGSLYAVFKNKRQLFFETLELYFERSSNLLKDRLQSGNTAMQSIHIFFESLIDDLVDEKTMKGCLMINTATELADQDDEIKHKLDIMFKSHERQFFKVLSQAQKEGDLAKNKDPKTLAMFLLMGVRGLKVYSQTDNSRNKLQTLVNTLLSTLR
mgnify:CR=1 FL=1|jgi:TetR/AcrR family transcriptional repressor of nem operon